MEAKADFELSCEDGRPSLSLSSADLRPSNYVSPCHDGNLAGVAHVKRYRLNCSGSAEFCGLITGSPSPPLQ